MDIDQYQEHSLHPTPYWKNMKVCSECYKKHQEIITKGRPNEIRLDWREQAEMDRHISPNPLER